MLKDFFSIALNNLRRRKLRSWLTMIGIFIGIAAVVSLISLGQGMQQAITGQFSSLSTDMLTVENTGTGFGPPGSTSVEKLHEHDVNIIESISGVELTIPTLLRSGKIEYNDAVVVNYVRSIPPEQEKYELIYDSIGLGLQEGRLLKRGDEKKVVVGANYAKEAKFDKAVKVGKKIKIQDQDFEVIGILESSGTFVINDAILMPQDQMEEAFEVDDELEMIVVKVDNPNIVEEVSAKIEKALRRDRGLDPGEEDFSVQTPMQAIEAVNTILTIINVIVIGIATISLIVGGIGIANTMYTSVLERRKEIGTMKAIGARNSDILSIFMIESGLLGLVGGLLGTLIGMSISYGVSVAANSALGTDIFKITFSPFLLVGAVLFSFLIGVISGTVPSVQASKLKPVEALRG